jgi:hypothetical protein
MEKGRRELLRKVPTRKLLASIKQDMRKLAKKAESVAKSKRK